MLNLPVLNSGISFINVATFFDHIFSDDCICQQRMIDLTGIDHGRLDKGELQQFRATPLPVVSQVKGDGFCQVKKAW